MTKQVQNNAVKSYMNEVRKMDKFMGTVNERVQRLLCLAIETRFQDESGSVGLTYVSHFMETVKGYANVPTSAMLDYILFLFDTSPVDCVNGKYTFNKKTSALYWQDKKNTFTANKVKEDGKSVKLVMDMDSVRERLAMVTWHEFKQAQAEKKPTQYKSKLLNAIKADWQAFHDGLLDLTNADFKILQQLAQAYGVELKQSKDASL